MNKIMQLCRIGIAVLLLSGNLLPAADTVLPTGKRITPLAAPGTHFELLTPDLPEFPQYAAGQAMSTALSPDGKSLLVLTSGFNRINGADGKRIEAASQEYVFVYDVTRPLPRKVQVVKIPNTFAGLAFSPSGKEFYVSGGVDDCIHSYSMSGGKWTEHLPVIRLEHRGGLGFLEGKQQPLATAGITVTADGQQLLAANVYNDSVSIIDLRRRRVTSEIDLRPGKVDARKAGTPGGEYPFWITVKGNERAYVSSLRDREVVVLALGARPGVEKRIALAGNPNKMTLSRDGSRLYVAADNSDAVSVIDTAAEQLIETIFTTGPENVVAGVKTYRGSAPNDVALSHDGKFLYATNGGSNSVAVVSLGKPSEVVGLMPTAWYPNAVSVSADDKRLYVVNAKSVAGPNPHFHAEQKRSGELRAGPAEVLERNGYILQLEKAGFATIPIPASKESRERLTQQVARNNYFSDRQSEHDRQTMEMLRQHIKHVIYIIKENRTFDQVLGDLGRGNGDRTLTLFGEKITPNFHKLARATVTLDNFYDSGEVSGDGWPWSTSGRESDYGVKAVILNYADRGTDYEYEGMNRGLNVGLATLAARKEANPKTPNDPDLLPGAVNVAEPDGPKGAAQGKGYLWDAVLRAGLTFREYGCMSDMNFESPREPYPFRAKVVVSRPSNAELFRFGDPYYRGFDPAYPDFFREAEWEREFDGYERNNNLPAFEIVQMPADHMGSFKQAIAGVNTPEAQQADNDYATGRLIARVAHSRYAKDTLIFIIEDDAQDGPDHVDAHRTTAYVAGAYVKHGAVISTMYTTVSMVRTMEDVLGLDHLNLNTATARPMTEVFDKHEAAWDFSAAPAEILFTTQLPLKQRAQVPPRAKPLHDASYWAAATHDLDFSGEDRADPEKFNRALWRGLKGTTYPALRGGGRRADKDD